MITIILGLFICDFSIDEGVIPINKNLWTLPFVLVTSGIAFAIFSILYYIIDVKKWWSGKPFYYVGLNSIIIYTGHFLTEGVFPFYIIPGEKNTHFLLLVDGMWNIFVWMLIAYILFMRKLYLTL